MHAGLPALLTLLLAVAPATTGRHGEDDLLGGAQRALKSGDHRAALNLANRAVTAAPKEARAYLVRGQAHELAGDAAAAAADYTKAIALAPRLADAYQLRGVANFKLARMKASVADFDKYLELRPERRAGHWQRGIACYYAGRYEEGQKQFEAYQRVDGNDVENVVWRYLCEARRSGRDKARKNLLPVGEDRRVPLKEVYALFQGRAKPADVLAAARAGQPAAAKLPQRLFYAHLYLGLYWESEGDRKKALEHLSLAAEQPLAGHYMWDVARVHRDLLRKELDPKAGP